MFTPHELAAEHARAMRIVKAVLTACDARAATARFARAHNLKPGDAPWILAIGKAAIGMAEGIKDVCGEPREHLIITVDGPPALSLPNIIRSDHPLPTQRSLDAGQAVKCFIEEAKAAGAPSLTVLISGGASSLICEPIPGIDLDEYRSVVQAMLAAGWNVQQMNTVRRAIDELKGGGLAQLAAPLPIDLLVISDVIGDTLHDIGSGPFTRSPTSPDDARRLVEGLGPLDQFEHVLVALSCRPTHATHALPERAIIAGGNRIAVDAAGAAAGTEGLEVVSQRTVPGLSLDEALQSAIACMDQLGPGEALCWGGEWPQRDVWWGNGAGGRAQAAAFRLSRSKCFNRGRWVLLALATDGVDGRPLAGSAPAAGAWGWSGMTWPDPQEVRRVLALAEPPFDTPDEIDACLEWPTSNSYAMFAARDRLRPPHEPPAHIFTGPTGTNVNDLLIAWRVR